MVDGVCFVKLCEARAHEMPLMISNNTSAPIRILQSQPGRTLLGQPSPADKASAEEARSVRASLSAAAAPPRLAAAAPPARARRGWRRHFDVPALFGARERTEGDAPPWRGAGGAVGGERRGGGGGG